MNPESMPKPKAKTKYAPTHAIYLALQVETNKNPEQLAEMIRQRSFTIDGVSSVSMLQSKVVKLA